MTKSTPKRTGPKAAAKRIAKAKARQAREEHVSDLEGLRIAEARLAEIDAGRVVPLSWAEARKELMTKKIGPAESARRLPEAKKNAAALAKIVGSVAEDVGFRCMVHTYKSKKLAKIEGAIECRGPGVTVSVVDVSLAEAEAMLAALVLARKAKR